MLKPRGGEENEDRESKPLVGIRCSGKHVGEREHLHLQPRVSPTCETKVNDLFGIDLDVTSAVRMSQMYQTTAGAALLLTTLGGDSDRQPKNPSAS